MLREEIKKYLMETSDDGPVVQELLLDKVTKYDDIAAEFLEWTKTYDYKKAKVKVGKYTAHDIHGMAPRLDGIGVYNFLVTLRDNPARAEEIIASGFMTK